MTWKTMRNSFWVAVQGSVRLPVAGGLVELIPVISIELLPEVILEAEFPGADTRSDHQQEYQEGDEKDP